MDRVFSAEDITDQFWSTPAASASAENPTMRRSASEWALERFLQEATSYLSDTSSSKSVAESDVVEIKDKDHQSRSSGSNNSNNNCSAQSKPTTTKSFNPPGSSAPMDSDQYQAFLKSKLNLACAAVAMTRDESHKENEGENYLSWSMTTFLSIERS